MLYEQIAPESWTNPDLKVFAIWKRFHEKNKTEAKLVVQHLESVHISIRKLINDLDESGNEGFPADAFGFGNR